MRKTCRFCKGEGKIFLPGFGSRICGNCKGTGQEPQTHFDEITESPEKLAEFISKVTIKAWFAQANNEQPHPNGSREWLEWLKQEITE